MKIKKGDRDGYLIGRAKGKAIVLWDDTNVVEFVNPKELQEHEDNAWLQIMCDMMCE